MKQQVYLDSCIVIYLIEGDPSIAGVVKDALLSATGERVQACVSPLTRLECRVRPLREKSLATLAHFDRFFASRSLRWGRLTRSVFDHATELRARHGVKTPDAIHFASAIALGCAEFWTNDRRLPADLEKQIAIRVLP